tara:strand:+ start:3597 stop:4415 length:819 start_codon:yes stop_codon:yes gene_type:complete
MAEEKTGLQRMNAEEMPDTVLPGAPKEDNPQSLQCKEIMAEMKIGHDKYNKIVRKIVTGTNHLFLVKCKVEKGEYYFLAEYLNDNFEKDFFGKSMAFSESQQCRDGISMIKRGDEVERLYKLYGEGPMLEFKFLHNDKQVTIKIGPPNNRTISYEDFKNSFIPINEAFMYENMPKTIDATNIVGMKLLEPPKQGPPPIPASGAPIIPKLPPNLERKDTNGDQLSGMDSEEFEDVNEGDMKVEELGGGRKKRRKKGSRSKKRRGRRKNRTKKN